MSSLITAILQIPKSPWNLAAVTRRTLHGLVQRKSRALYSNHSQTMPFHYSKHAAGASCALNQHSATRFSALTYAILYFSLKTGQMGISGPLSRDKLD